MSLKTMLLPATLVVVIALAAPYANAQTMGEYATTTAGVASGGGSIGTGFTIPMPPSMGGDLGGGSGTWGASRLGASFEDRAAAVSASGMGADFESRAAALTGSHASNESRWPGTALSSGNGADRFGNPDRFKSEDRFSEADRFSSQNRWPASEFSDHMGLDAHYNSINGN